MAIDYAAAKKMVTRHRGALTRAKKKGPTAVVAAVDAFYDDFDRAGWPLPDAWRDWAAARADAILELRRAGW